MFSYNTQIHAAHGFTPHEAFYGREARIPSEFVKRKVPLTYIDFVNNPAKKLSYTQSQAAETLNKSKEKYKQYYDRLLYVKNFEVGDKVYLQKEPRS